jgi:hypothetical protein
LFVARALVGPAPDPVAVFPGAAPWPWVPACARHWASAADWDRADRGLVERDL